MLYILIPDRITVHLKERRKKNCGEKSIVTLIRAGLIIARKLAPDPKYPCTGSHCTKPNHTSLIHEVSSPSCLQATPAFTSVHELSHIVRQTWLTQISTCPWVELSPTSLRSPSVQVIREQSTPASLVFAQL